MSISNSPLLARLPEGTEIRPIDAITPYGDNPRKHPDRQIRKLMRSLEKFGWTNLLTTMAISSAGTAGWKLRAGSARPGFRSGTSGT